MEARGVAFQKKPDEGRMKGLAFALDPDGYVRHLTTRGLKYEKRALFCYVLRFLVSKYLRHGALLYVEVIITGHFVRGLFLTIAQLCNRSALRLTGTGLR
jgi:hypothetical protein